MAKIKVLFTDSNKAYTHQMIKTINAETNMEVISYVHNGKDLLEKLKTTQVDLLILDLEMSYIDGLSILKILQTDDSYIPPVHIIVYTAFKRGYVKYKTQEYGADYFLTKPLDFKRLVSVINEVWNSKYNKSFDLTEDESIDDLETKIMNLLKNIGIPIYLPGYKFIKEAVYTRFKEDTPLKAIYSKIADQYNDLSFRIQRKMMNAIEFAYDYHDKKIIADLISSQQTFPNVDEFITSLVSRLKNEQQNKSTNEIQHEEISNNHVEVTIDAIEENINLARLIAGDFILPLEPDIEQLNDLKSIISEAITNCIHHAYENKAGKIKLIFERQIKTVIIKIIDYGKGIKNTTKAKELYFSTKKEHSGMGLSVIDTFSDECHIQSKFNEGTTITIKKIFD